MRVWDWLILRVPSMNEEQLSRMLEATERIAFDSYSDQSQRSLCVAIRFEIAEREAARTALEMSLGLPDEDRWRP